MDRMRAAVVQMAHGDSLDANLERARRLLDEARAAGARLALLPEYFFALPRQGPEAASRAAAALHAFFADASRDTGMAVAGNVIEANGDGLANVGVVYEDGRLVLAQPKVHPMPREAAAGVRPGPAFRRATVAGVPTGMLVCADVLYPEATRILALQGAQILLNPVMSPWRQEDLTKGSRDAIFVARAYDAGAFVLKAGGFRRPGAEAFQDGGPPAAVAGRSLVAAPWGVLARYQDDFAEQVIVAELDFETLARFRKGQEAFPPRQPHAYRDLV